MRTGPRHRRERQSPRCARQSGASIPATQPRRPARRAAALMTESPLVVASASIRCSTPRGRINKPRSAPACSTAVRMSMSISLSRTISRVTACDTLIAVARSRCSTGLAVGSKGGFNCSLRAALRCAAVNASGGIPGKIWTDLSLLARRGPSATFRGRLKAGPRPSHVTERVTERARSISPSCIAANE
jgi:hypothetical protein